MKQNLLFFALLASLSIFTACEPDDPVIPNEEEVITTLTYTLTPSGGGTPVELRFEDLDGDGGMDPTVSGGILQANSTYSGALALSNEQESPAEDIGAEVLAEAEDHQFFFQTNIAGLRISYADQDADGNPLGLQTTLTTAEAGSGSITLILRHEPNKAAAGVADGDISQAGGETDIEVTFDVEVQ